MEQKRLMILGAGRGQVGLYRAAKRLGYHTIAAGTPGNYPGLQLADEVCCVDISSPEDVLAAAREKKIHGIATACLDTGIAALGYVCDRMGLPGLGIPAAECSGDKLKMKEAFRKNGVCTAEYRSIRSRDDLHAACGELRFPLIIKAVDLQGSRGIYICRDRAAVEQSFSMVMEETKKDYCILEEFIEGTDLGVQAMIVDGEMVFIAPTSNVSFRGTTNIPVGHGIPCPYSEEALSGIRDLVTNAAAAVGLDNCVLNVDLLERDGAFYVVELTGRLGANCLPELLTIRYGVPIYEAAVLLAMGEGERVKRLFRESYPSCSAGYARMLYSTKAGRVRSLAYTGEPGDDIVDMTFFAGPGDEVHAFRNSRDCIGQVVVKGVDLPACEKRMGEILSRIEIILE